MIIQFLKRNFINTIIGNIKENTEVMLIKVTEKMKERRKHKHKQNKK